MFVSNNLTLNGRFSVLAYYDDFCFGQITGFFCVQVEIVVVIVVVVVGPETQQDIICMFISPLTNVSGAIDKLKHLFKYA